MSFNHFDAQGRAHMVDITGKEPTLREATAEAVVHLGPELVEAIGHGGLAKGDVLAVARLAGLQAVKETPRLIPLAHPLPVHHAAITFDVDAAAGAVSVRCNVKSFARTGLEMEAMTGANLAALTIYDMCKGMDRSISIRSVRLLRKSGGKSGIYSAPDEGA